MVGRVDVTSTAVLQAAGLRTATEHFGQQPPPPGGYSVARFEGYLETMQAQLAAFQDAKDARAVFQLTYLTFSRQVLAALKAGRFCDMAWATDMCCRFVEVYLEQVELWERRHPNQCSPWRMAFEAMEQGRLNVLQAMLLGMNAHIHYDLAFVTLGACRHAGDLPSKDVAQRALTSSRGGVPVVRYRDFLLVNQIGWESIPLIQDTVLGAFSRTLYWGNRLTGYRTRFLGQRVLLEARDASWFQTCLLIHAGDGEERGHVTQVIDAFAASIADLIGALTPRPWTAWSNANAWRRRFERLGPEVVTGLLRMARHNPVIAELALQQLAFAGADPEKVLEALLAEDEDRLASVFVQLVARHAPAHRKASARAFLDRPADDAVRLAQALISAGGIPEELEAPSVVQRARLRESAWVQTSQRLLEAPEVHARPLLRDALADYIRRTEKALPEPLRSDFLRAQTAEQALALSDHPDDWVRLCSVCSEGERMASTIERVLFLKETQLFVEIEPAVLVHLAERLEERSYAAGEALVREGTSGAGIHLVRSGTLEVTQRRGEERVHIAQLGPRDSVGELSALNETPASADCVALSDVQTWFLPTTALSHLLHQHPRLAIGIIRVLSQRLMTTTLRVRDSVAATETAA